MRRPSPQVFARRHGFTLLEVIVVMSMLVVVMLMISVVLVGTIRIQQQAMQMSQHLIARGALADQFRSDVARAAAAPKTFGVDSAGPACLILRMTDGKHIVYRWRKGQMERSQEAGGARSSQALPLGNPDANVEFDQSEKGRILTLRLIERSKRGGNKQVTEFAAALGGDFQ